MSWRYRAAQRSEAVAFSGPGSAIIFQPKSLGVVPAAIRRHERAGNEVCGQSRALANTPGVGAADFLREPAVGDQIVQRLLQRADEIVEASEVRRVRRRLVAIQVQSCELADVRWRHIVRHENEDLGFHDGNRVECEEYLLSLILHTPRSGRGSRGPLPLPGTRRNQYSNIIIYFDAAQSAERHLRCNTLIYNDLRDKMSPLRTRASGGIMGQNRTF